MSNHFIRVDLKLYLHLDIIYYRQQNIFILGKIFTTCEVRIHVDMLFMLYSVNIHESRLLTKAKTGKV